MQLCARRLVVLLFVTSFVWGQSSVIRQIQQLPSPEDGSELAAMLLALSRAPGVAAVSLWVGSDPASKEKARAVLNDMDEVALDPLLKAKGNLTASDQAWRMIMVVDTLRDLRTAAAHLFDAQLANRQPIPSAKSRAEEAGTSTHRVCDEAYVQMSRLAAANPEGNDLLLRMQTFLSLPEARRDEEIQRARQSTEWRSLRK